MTIVRHLEVKELDGRARHSEVEATGSLVEADGEKFLQIDTYGSSSRAIPGKVSQSIRLSKLAFAQLLQLGQKHF